VVQFEAVVMSPVGLHARPAALFVKKVAASGLKVTVEPLEDGVARASADGKSILSVLSLGIKSGTTIRVTIEGENAAALAGDLQELLADPSV
jgi:phosphotransferase system HPr (HPr) family protein